MFETLKKCERIKQWHSIFSANLFARLFDYKRSNTIHDWATLEGLFVVRCCCKLFKNQLTSPLTHHLAIILYEKIYFLCINFNWLAANGADLLGLVNDMQQTLIRSWIFKLFFPDAASFQHLFSILWFACVFNVAEKGRVANWINSMFWK